MTVTTRFAPSPTGFLHIGGARTALFNWLFAKHFDGRFLLRIEDTDRERSTDAAIEAILDGMNWLGLNADEPPIYQSQRADRHRDVAEALLSSGKAYKCYVTPEELAARRDEGQALLAQVKSGALEGSDLDTAKVRANKLLAPFRSPYRDGGLSEPAGQPYTVRLRAPDDGAITVADGVQGDVTVNSGEIDDLVLLRADGTPTYMLAVVVDDHDMKVSQVIRGDDHLTNTFRQLPIYQAMGWSAPSFAHVPLIHGPDGKKLSKRHGALGVEAYRELGYLPEGVKNYLLRLGWSHGDEEFITEDQAIKWFGLDGLNKGPARMDFEKFGHINSLHIRACDPHRLLKLVLSELEKDRQLSDEEKQRLELALPDLASRGQTLPELATAAEFLFVPRPVEITGKAKKKLKGDALNRLKEVRDYLESQDTWSAETIAEGLETFCTERELSMGQVGPPLRTALTAGLPSPDLHLILYWLGKNETLGRIDDVLSLPVKTDN